jgi:5-methyltetrahydrofolate--homocysteine methyltransferase
MCLFSHKFYTVRSRIVFSKKGTEMAEEDLKELSKAVAELDEDRVKKFTQVLLDKNVDASVIMEKGLVDGIKKVGRKYEAGEFFLSELIYGASVFDAAFQSLAPSLKEIMRDKKQRGVVVLGTVAGDIHSIGKDILKTMLIAGGFEVHDLGVDVPVDQFIKAVKDFKPEIVGASALLSTTIPIQQQLIESLKKEGLRSKVKVIIGGAATTEQWATQIGADGWGSTAVDGIKRITELTIGADKE